MHFHTKIRFDNPLLCPFFSNLMTLFSMAMLGWLCCWVVHTDSGSGKHPCSPLTSLLNRHNLYYSSLGHSGPLGTSVCFRPLECQWTPQLSCEGVGQHLKRLNKYSNSFFMKEMHKMQIEGEIWTLFHSVSYWLMLVFLWKSFFDSVSQFHVPAIWISNSQRL